MPENGTAMMITIGAQSYADAEPALGFASVLAKAFNLPLRAFLLEEEAAMLASAFPLAKAMLPGGNALEVTLDAMAEAYRKDLKALQADLNRLAGPDGNKWIAENINSDLRTFASSNLGRNRLVILGFQRLIRNTGDIIILHGDGSSTVVLDKLCDLLSNKTSLPVTTLVTGNEAAPASVLQQLARRSPALLLVSQELANRLGVDELVSTSRCPVIICPETFQQTLR